jgi:hypothetical protein
MEYTMVWLASAALCLAFTTTASLAQDARLDRAQGLLRAGHPEQALHIFGLLPDTPAVLQGQAEAHILIASHPRSVERCGHLRTSIEFGSRAQAVGLVEFARKQLLDEGCQN